MQEPLVAIQIVTWNSMPHLRFCLESLAKQTYKNVSTLIIDNASTDGTLEYLATTYPHIPIIKNTTNRGFAAAHNQGIACHSRPSGVLGINSGGNPGPHSYILILNPDVILTPNYLATLIEIMERESRAAGITGQLLRYTLKNKSQVPNPNDHTNPKFQILSLRDITRRVTITKQIKLTNIIDSEGLEILPWRAVRDINSGSIIGNWKLEIGNLPPKAVWGISGACALYRLSALEDIKIPIIENRSEGIPSQRTWSPKWFSEQTGGSRRVPTVGPCSERPEPRGEAPGDARKEYPSDTPSEYFDEDFFCYKEDVDMSWRMRARGWKFIYTPCAQAFHHRGIGNDKAHSQRRLLINQWSYRNHFYTLLKNETITSFLVHAPLVLGYEIAKLVYYLLVQPRTLLVLWDVCKNTRRMLKKRHHIWNSPSSSSTIKHLDS